MVTVKTLVNTEGDAGMDAALNDLGMWPESRSDRVPTTYGERFYSADGDACYDDAGDRFHIFSCYKTDEDCRKAVRFQCGVCHLVWFTFELAYDDGLCGQCRDENDRIMSEDSPEANRLVARIRSLFGQDMSPGQVLAMAANIMRGQAVS